MANLAVTDSDFELKFDVLPAECHTHHILQELKYHAKFC